MSDLQVVLEGGIIQHSKLLFRHPKLKKIVGKMVIVEGARGAMGRVMLNGEEGLCFIGTTHIVRNAAGNPMRLPEPEVVAAEEPSTEVTESDVARILGENVVE